MNAYVNPNVPPSIATMRAKYAHRKIIASNVSHADALKGTWPVGAVFVACLETVFAPEPFVPSKAKPVETNMHYERFRAAQVKAKRGSEAVHDEARAEYLRKILAQPVRSGATEEELAEAGRTASRIGQ